MYQRTRIKLAKQTVEARQQVRRRPMQNIGRKGREPSNLRAYLRMGRCDQQIES